MEKTTIRFARAEDYRAVEKLMQQVQDLHVAWRPDIYKACAVVLPREEFIDAVAGERIIVAEMGGAVSGMASFMYRHIQSDRQVARSILFIDAMVVDKARRGRGLGRRLFDFLKALARDKNCDGIELQVNARNTAAYEMYKKCGFSEKSINMELL